MSTYIFTAANCKYATIIKSNVKCAFADGSLTGLIQVGPWQLVILWYKHHLAREQSSTSDIQNKAT